MTEACDPDADIENLRKTIKLQTGEDVKLTRKQMCDAYDNIHGGKLPLPPLVMTADRTYLIDRSSPLKHLDYELLFDSATKRAELKRIARKIGLTSQIEQKTKKQLVDAIGKRLRYLKVREPIKIVSKRLIPKDVPTTAVNNINTAVRNNTAVNNLNTAVRNNNRKNFNNNSAFNNTENRKSNFNNFGGNVNVNANRINNNFNRNRANNTRVNLSGNKNGLTFKTNQNTGTTTLNFPKKLKFKPSFIAPSTNSGNQNAGGTKVNFPNKLKLKPSFISPNTGSGNQNAGGTKVNFPNKLKLKPPAMSTGNSGGSQSVQLGNGFKKKPAFLNQGTNAPTGNAKQPSPANGPKKPGMFNWMYKKKNAAGAGAAGAAAGAAAVATGAAVNGSKKCGMFNRMMGRCKKESTANANANKPANNKPANANANANKPANNKPVNANANANANANNKPVNANANANANANNKPVNANANANANVSTNDVNIVANQILEEINKDVNKAVVAGVNNNNGFNANAEFNKQMALRTNGVNNRKLSKNNKALVASVTSGIMNNVVKKDIANRINSRNLVAVPNKKNLNGNAKLNNATKNMILSINKATTLKELRKIYLKGSLKLHPNKGGNTAAFQMFMNAHNKKLLLLNSGNTKSNVNYVANGIMKEINKDVINQISNKPVNNKKILAIANKPMNNKKADVEYVANQILKQLQNDVAKEIRLGGRAAEPIYNNRAPVNTNNRKNVEFVANRILNQLTREVKTEIRKGGRAAEPVYNSNSNSNSNNNVNNKKINNPLFEPNMKNNPIFNNSVNEIPKEVEAQENNVRNMIKNFNSERNSLQNKITKELNLRPNNNGVFRERKGLTKGRIGVWAQELRKAETIEDLKKIENELNKKVELRKNIENKYTKMGLTNKSEKSMHRNSVVKFKNDVNARRKEIEAYLTKTPSVSNKGSYQSKVNRLQREFPKGTGPNVRRNWMKKSKIYTGRIQKASKYGDMVKAYNNATKSFNNLSKSAKK
jgi:hypothetical protein